MYKKNTPERKMNLVICDSPGFGDTAGVEVDIANGVGMINALHGARSVRVVFYLVGSKDNNLLHPPLSKKWQL